MAEKQFYVKLHTDLERWEVMGWDGEDEPEDIGEAYHRGPFDTWGRASECGHEDFSSYAPLVSIIDTADDAVACLLYTSPSPRDRQRSRMPSSA